MDFLWQRFVGTITATVLMKQANNLAVYTHLLVQTY